MNNEEIPIINETDGGYYEIYQDHQGNIIKKIYHNMENFIQDDYKVPQTSNYLKLTEGEHTFRIMSPAITGYEYFTKENKPIRAKEEFDRMPDDIKDGGRVNNFIAFVIWNYEAKRLQVAELTQKTIITPLIALAKNPKWGNPDKYDITISRKGLTKNDTEYSILPSPHSPVPPEATEALKKAKINLEALYANEDPFK